MAFSTSDNAEEDFVPSELPSVGSSVEETAIKLRLIPQGAGSRLDSDTVRGQIPLFSRTGILQIARTSSGAVSTGTTSIPVDDTIPQNTEGNEIYTVSLTPSHIDNILLVEASVSVATGTGGSYISAALFQDSTANALASGAVYTLTADVPLQIKLSHKMTAGTTSATTFKVRVGPSAGATITVNGAAAARLFGGVLSSYIQVTEIAP